jgi:hypothetical protein
MATSDTSIPMFADSAPKPKKKRGIIGRIFRWILLLGFLGAAGFAADIYLYPVPDHEILNFVPKDAIFVIEADDPIENWKTFSDTKIWRHLKKNSAFADIEASCDYLDTLVRDNSTIFSLISGKKLLISAQMTKVDDYDFVYIMDLKRGRKSRPSLIFSKVCSRILDCPSAKRKLKERKSTSSETRG